MSLPPPIYRVSQTSCVWEENPNPRPLPFVKEKGGAAVATPVSRRFLPLSFEKGGAGGGFFRHTDLAHKALDRAGRWLSMFLGLGLFLPSVVWSQTSRRPTAAGGLYGTAQVRSFAKPDGKVKVWWATSGPHAPPLADTDQNQIPDLVELVALVGDEVQTFVQTHRMRQPLADSTLLPRSDQNGGDALLDVYLIDFSGGDGQYVTEACSPPAANGAQQCVGFLLLENDFARSHYKDYNEAIRVVLTHEYFHALQNAYRNGVPGWFSEGSATWFEELFYPTQSDFEHLTSPYFQTPERTLSDRQRGPTDSFAYGASIFFYFLEQTFGVSIVPAILEAFEKAPKDEDIVVSIDKVLQAKQTSLDAVFTKFAIFNAFTGRRAVASQGYPQAQRFAEVPVTSFNDAQPFNWNLSVKPLAAKYAVLSVSKPLSLQVVAQDGFPLGKAYAVSAEAWASQGPFVPLSAEKTYFAPSPTPLLLIVPNGGLVEETAVQVQMRFGSPPAEKPEPPAETTSEPTSESTAEAPNDGSSSDTQALTETSAESFPSGGCSGCSLGLGSPTPVVVAALLLLLGLRRQRRS